MFAASCPVTVTSVTVFGASDGTFITNWFAPGAQLAHPKPPGPTAD